MRIAIFTDDYLPSVSGVVTSIQNQKRALELLGHEVFVVAPKFPHYRDREKNVIRLASFPAPKNMKLVDGRRGALVYPRLEQRFAKYHFDVVHTETEFLVGILGHNVARKFGLPHVHTLHTLYAEMIYDYPVDVFLTTVANSLYTAVQLKKLPGNWLSHELISPNKKSRQEFIKERNWDVAGLFCNAADAVIFPSDHLQKKVVSRGLLPPSFVIPNGIFTDFYSGDSAQKRPPFKRQKGDFFVATIGRVSGEKRQEILLDAAKILPKNFKFIVAGDGPILADLKARARRENLTNRVFFTGRVDRKTGAKILAFADVFAMTSYRFDNQPMVILEAISSGKPIVFCDDNLREGLKILSKWSRKSDENLAEKLRGENAILTDDIDGKSFARAFEWLQKNAETRASLGENSRAISRDFDSISIAKKTLAVYENVKVREPIDESLVRKLAKKIVKSPREKTEKSPEKPRKFFTKIWKNGAKK